MRSSFMRIDSLCAIESEVKDSAFINTELERLQLIESKVDQSEVRDSTLTKTKWWRCNFRSLYGRCLDFEQARLELCAFDSTVFEECDFTEAEFVNCTFPEGYKLVKVEE